MTLTETQDATIWVAASRVAAGRKWNASKVVQQTKSLLKHGNIVSRAKRGQWTRSENLVHRNFARRISGKRKEADLATSSEPSMMFFPVLRT